MADMKVKISGDLADIKSALVGLQNQLKGVGTAGKAAGAEASSGLGGIGKSLAGLAAGYLSFRTLVGGIGLVVQNTVDAERAQAQLRAALESSAGAAGLTVDELNAMASSLQAVSKFDDDAITGAQTLLLQFDKIGRDTFPRATQAVLDFAERMGVDLDAAAKTVGKALQDPEKGLKALREVGVKLSDEQVELIERLWKVGDAAGAQAMVLDELAKKMGGAAAASRDTLGGALEGLKNDFNNLLEGDAGGEGVRGATQAINDLGEMMRSPGVQAGFQSIITWAAQALTAVAGLGQAVRDAFADTANKSRQGLEARRFELRERRDLLLQGREEMGLGRMVDTLSKVGIGPTLDEVNRELAEVEARLRSIQQSARTPAAPGTAPASPFVTMEEMTIKASDANRAADEAKRKVEALRREQEKLRQEAERAEEARKKELEALNKRIEEGMLEVDIALKRATGDQAGAAFLEIDRQYAQLIADLKAKGDASSLAIVQSLINHEKFQAELDALLSKADAAMRGFGTTVATSEGSVNAGELSEGDADAAIEASRKQQLATLRALRQQAIEYYRTHSGPEAQAALEAIGQLDGQIRQLEDAQQTFREFAKDQAAQSLEQFFMDLASGAKSFKEAFLDMVRSFLAGIAQMIAAELAKKAAAQIVGMFHAGGLVGAGGTLRTVDPMAFFAAPRYHSGGIAGLAPNEVPAILQRGEEVLTARDARHRNNGGGLRPPSQRFIFVDDARRVSDYLNTSEGEQAIVRIIQRNPGAFEA